MSTRSSDVLVVGGGAIGLTSAWYLARSGCTVRVVTREPVGVGASAGNAGMIVPSHLVPLAAPGVIAQGLRWMLDPQSPFHIRPRVDWSLIHWLWSFRAHCTPDHVARAAPLLRNLAMTSVDLFTTMQDLIGDFGWTRSGLIMLYRTERYRSDLLHAADFAEEHGLRVRRLDAAGVRHAEPSVRSEVAGGVLYEDDGRIDPDAWLDALAVDLAGMGVTFESGVTVHGVRPRSSGSAVVVTDRGERQAGTVVLAAGAWAARLGPRRLPVQPAKGYSITVDSGGSTLGVPMILVEEKVTITPMPGRIRFGGTLSMTGFDGSVDARRVEPIRAQVARYRPDLSRETIDGLEVWSGFRPATPDGLPIIGRAGSREDVIVATGHGMMGITMAPATGHLVADLVLGRTPIMDPAPFAADRF